MPPLRVRLKFLSSRCSFGGAQVGDDLIVVVQSEAGATALAVDAPASVSADDGESVAVTITLQDDDGNAAVMGEDLDVMLSSATGSFSDKAGETETTVTIKAGTSSAMVYYSDTTVGEATITASTDDLTGTDTIKVTTEIVMVDDVDFMIADSDGVAREIARDLDTITVTALATPGKVPTVTIGNLVDAGLMDESPDSLGTYTRSDKLAMGTQDGTHAVTVNLGDASGEAPNMVIRLTIPHRW